MSRNNERPATIETGGPNAEPLSDGGGSVFSRRSVAVSGGVIIILAALLLMFSKGFIEKYERQSEADSARFQLIEAKLAEYQDLSAVVMEFRQELATFQGVLRKLDAKFLVLEKRVADLKEGNQGEPGWAAKYRRVGEQLAALRREFSVLKESGEERQYTKAVSLLALGRLRAKLTQGKSCANDLAIIESLMPVSLELKEGLNNLSVPCDNTIRTQSELIRTFPTAAGFIMKQQKLLEGPHWWSQVGNRLKSLVVIRPVGDEISGTGQGATLARVEGLLKSGNLSSAVGLIESLELEEGPALDWATGLQEHVAAVAVVDQIMDVLITKNLARPDGDG